MSMDGEKMLALMNIDGWWLLAIAPPVWGEKLSYLQKPADGKGQWRKPKLFSVTDLQKKGTIMKMLSGFSSISSQESYSILLELPAAWEHMCETVSLTTGNPLFPKG